MMNQLRVADWMRKVFSSVEVIDIRERATRAVEEVVELAQACDVSPETLHKLVDYVYARPVGEAGNEIAGSLVTLYATASALGLDADLELERELRRINTPEVIARVQRRQHEKREALR